MSAELGSNLPPEVTNLNQDRTAVINGLQELSGDIPTLSINLPFKQLPERIKELLTLAGVSQESDTQIGYYYQGDPEELYVMVHGQYRASTFDFNWFPSHPNAISGITICPALRNLGDYVSVDPPFSLLKIRAQYSVPTTEDVRRRSEYLQSVISDPILGYYHLELLKDLTSFTRHCAKILSGNILRPES